MLPAATAITCLTPKVFRAIPLHINPGKRDADDEPWLCDLSLLVSTASPNSVFAIGLDDSHHDRFLFCTSLSVAVKQMLYVDEDDPEGGLALQHQRDFALRLRQQNQSIGHFLATLANTVTTDQRLKAFMLVDDEDVEEDEDGLPSDWSVLTLSLHFDAVDTFLTPAALASGIITGEETVEHVNLRFEVSRTARAAHVASLAFMMGAHARLGGDSLIGRMLGTDLLHLVCDAYRLRLYECRRHVWME